MLASPPLAIIKGRSGDEGEAPTARDLALELSRAPLDPHASRVLAALYAGAAGGDEGGGGALPLMQLEELGPAPKPQQHHHLDRPATAGAPWHAPTAAAAARGAPDALLFGAVAFNCYGDPGPDELLGAALRLRLQEATAAAAAAAPEPAALQSQVSPVGRRCYIADHPARAMQQQCMAMSMACVCVQCACVHG